MDGTGNGPGPGPGPGPEPKPVQRRDVTMAWHTVQGASSV